MMFFSGCAQRLADAYLSRSFGHTDQHDVHYPYAAYHETHAGDSHEKDEEASRELIP